MKRKLVSLVNFRLLVGGLFLINHGLGFTSASAEPPIKESALPGLTQNWDKKLLANDSGDPCNSSRFTCVLDGQAVRDNETGLVWERTPLETRFTWIQALGFCYDRNVGGRKGWHLPTVEQLASLIDPSTPGTPKLPTGHPFQLTFPPETCCGTATTFEGNQALNYQVVITNGGVSAGLKSGAIFNWCVRGGRSTDGDTHATLH